MLGWATDYIEGRPRLAVDWTGSGPLVLFMHGVGGNRTNWDEQLMALGPFFKAVAWDARGYGLSRDYDGALDFADFSSDILRVLEHYDAESAHLVGLSMGGRIAQDFYERCPDRVATLTLADTFPGHAALFREDDRDEFIRRRIQPFAEGKTPREIAPAVARSLVGPSASEEVFQRLVDSLAAVRPASYVKALDATMSYDRMADLARFDVPTLLIFGADDPLTTPALGRKMHANIKDSTFVEIAEAGHLSNIEKPEAFNDALMTFLSRHGARARYREGAEQ